MQEFIAIGLILVVVFNGLMLAFYAFRIKHAGPNEALIVYGRGTRHRRSNEIRFRFVISGRTFVWPIVERAAILSLEPRRAEASFRDLQTSSGQRVGLNLVIQYKVGHSEEDIANAVLQLLAKSESEKDRLVTDLAEEEVRKIVASSEWPELASSAGRVQEVVAERVAARLASFGLETVSLIVR
jgi:flotillin